MYVESANSTKRAVHGATMTQSLDSISTKRLAKGPANRKTGHMSEASTALQRNTLKRTDSLPNATQSNPLGEKKRRICMTNYNYHELLLDTYTICLLHFDLTDSPNAELIGLEDITLSDSSIKSISIQTSPVFTKNSLLAKKQKRRAKNEATSLQHGKSFEDAKPSAVDNFDVHSDSFEPSKLSNQIKSKSTGNPQKEPIPLDDYIEASWEEGISLEASLDAETMEKQFRLAQEFDRKADIREKAFGKQKMLEADDTHAVHGSMQNAGVYDTESVSSSQTRMEVEGDFVPTPKNVNGTSDLQKHFDKMSTLGQENIDQNVNGVKDDESAKPSNLMDGINVPDKNLMLQRV